MPGTQIGGFNPGEVEHKRGTYEATAYVDFCIHAGCASGYPEGNLTAIWKSGATGVKFFVSSAGPSWPQTFDGEIIDRFREIAGFGGLAMIHAENDKILRDNEKRLHKEGRKDYTTQLEIRPQKIPIASRIPMVNAVNPNIRAIRICDFVGGSTMMLSSSPASTSF